MFCRGNAETNPLRPRDLFLVQSSRLHADEKKRRKEEHKAKDPVVKKRMIEKRRRRRRRRRMQMFQEHE